MANFNLQDYLPMSPTMGPPLPRILGIFWPWYEEEVPPPEPKKYFCPYCPETFATYEDLVAHVQTIHPAERIPIDIIWE